MMAKALTKVEMETVAFWITDATLWRVTLIKPRCIQSMTIKLSNRSPITKTSKKTIIALAIQQRSLQRIEIFAAKMLKMVVMSQVGNFQIDSVQAALCRIFTCMPRSQLITARTTLYLHLTVSRWLSQILMSTSSYGAATTPNANSCNQSCSNKN